MSKIYVGIDPGISGAIAILWPDDEKLHIFDMPVFEIKVGKSIKREVDPVNLSCILSCTLAKMTYLEKVGAMPGQGVTSMFNFGRSYGVVQGVLAALQLPVMLIRPATWKKLLSVSKGKDAARKRASELMPAHSHPWPLKTHDVRAEAAPVCLRSSG